MKRELNEELDKLDAVEAARGLLYQIKHLKAENENLKKTLEEQEQKVEKIAGSFYDAEQEYSDEIAELENQLILAKSLIAIPDNYPDCVAALIRERVKAWDLTRANSGYEAGWRTDKDTAPVNSDLVKALKLPKRGRKTKQSA